MGLSHSCRCLFYLFDELGVSFVRNVGNSVAHCVAKSVARVSEICKWEFAPSWLLHIVHEDSGLP